MAEYDWADKIVSVSPSYWADIPGQFKVFIDRCTPWCNTHEPHAKLKGGKKGYTIALRTGPSMPECKRIISSIEHFYGHLEIEICGSLGLCGIEYRENIEDKKVEIKDFCEMIMNDIIIRLKDKDDKAAYEYVKQIGAESAASDKYLGMIPEFAGLLTEKSSYVRTRGFGMICNQARWADDGQIEAVFDQMSQLLYDDKPTVVRQCLKALHEVAIYRPELADRISRAVEKIDPDKYKDSMSPLIKKDIKELLIITESY